MPLAIANDNTTAANPLTREAPHNVEAEQALIGAILANNEALNHVGQGLVADDFYAPIHQRIYRAILQFHDRGMIANPITLKHHFTKDDGIEDAYLARLVAAATTVINVADYAHIIHDLSLKRALIGVGEMVVNRAFDHRDEAAALEQVEQAEQMLFNLATDGDAEGQFRPLKMSLAEALTRTENAFKMDGAVVGIDTGFIDLNAKLGGLHNSDLIILAGRPSMGKTALATNIAHRAAKWLAETDAEKMQAGEKPRSVGFFSLEMSAEQLAMRLLAAECQISSHNLQRGNLSNEEFARLVQASQALGRMPFHIDDTPALSISAVRTRARRLKRVHNLSLLVVDYLQLIRGSSNNSNNRVQEISEITQGLKAIAKELQIPVIALSQLSRAVEQREDKRPQLADLRESGSIEQDADLVMFVYREEYYLSREEPKPDDEQKYATWKTKYERAHGKAQVIIAKHRNGPIGNVDMAFKSEFTQFDNLAQGEYEEMY